MKILMIAPEPFFEPRGTPFSEYFRIKSICGMGHKIDLVTYPIGENKKIENLNIFRSFGSILFKSVKTGPSAAKLFLDIFLFFRAFRRILLHRYDLIHTHEEANIMGAVLGKIFKTPQLYDMHSSLVQQMENFRFSRSGMIKAVFKWMEKVSLTSAGSVIVICRSLYDYAAKITRPEKLTQIENFMDDSLGTPDMNKLKRMNKEMKRDNRIVVTYAGTLETYQGIPMLLESISLLPAKFNLILIGGKEAQIETLKERASELGIRDRVRFTGRVAPEEIPYYLEVSDILVSPRILGTNIPLKVYSFLKSGKPLVATNLYTHIQTLTDEISILVDPDPEAFSKGIMMASGKEGKNVSKNAQKFCRENYSQLKYDALVSEALDKAIKKKKER